MRLGCTNKPADRYFDGIVVFAIVFFSLEIAVCCMGKDDYFPGFFFGLDVISTATLFLDLSLVSEAIFGGDGDADKARSGRTARVGAKMGRVIRVLRLIRIVKLYKAFSSTRSTHESRKPGFDYHTHTDWGGEDDAEEVQRVQENYKESLVGKKLSARTTQRTIILVLVLLIVLPLLSMSTVMKTPASAAYGASEVHQAFVHMMEGTGEREAYERALLKYVYYHNWFAGHDRCPRELSSCSEWYYSHNFWVGISGKADAASLQAIASHAQLSRVQVEKWNGEAMEQDDLYNFGTMPPEARDVLSSSWRETCMFGGRQNVGFSVLRTPIADKVGYAVKCPGDIRTWEKEQYTPELLSDEKFDAWHFVFYFDMRPYTRQEAAFSLMTTVFVCIVLCVASLFFSSDANTLVLQPVEQMITRVEAIRDNPLKALTMADEDFKLEEMQKSKKKQGQFSLHDLRQKLNCLGTSRSELMETVILEKTIIKLGSLLALGFGEAGANIVSQNMHGAATSGVNAMIEGTRVDCIVGHVQIRDFSTATEVLQQQIMRFVNQIAEIVHGVVDEFHGAVNKNSGDTFLIIWRAAGVPKEQVSRLADMSVFAFAKILGGVHRSIVLAAYRFHPGLQQRLGSGCRVNLSFGLHHGWAIEGAVGSEFKIDASYLSPNVSIAASVEHATRIYDVSLLVSETVVALCSKDMVANMRLIDKVRFVGTQHPIELYCVDLDYMSLDVDEPLRRGAPWSMHLRYQSRQYMDARKYDLWNNNISISSLFDNDIFISNMRRIYSEEFRQNFSMGYQNYTQGEWQVARQLLSKTVAMHRSKDGPSLALLDFMDTPYQFQAPPGWTGVRNLGDLESM